MFKQRKSAFKNSFHHQQNSQTQQYERFEIAKDIFFEIINTRVEKAQKNIFGNFAYEVRCLSR